MCIRTATGFNCQTTSNKNTEAIVNTLTTTAPNKGGLDGLNDIVGLARRLQAKYVLGLFAGAGSLFLINLFAIAALRWDAKYPVTNKVSSNRYENFRKTAVVTVWSSVAFALASAASLDQTANALTFVTRLDPTISGITIVAGRTLSVLQWIVFGFSVIFGVGIVSIFPPSKGGMGPPMMGGMPPPMMGDMPPPMMGGGGGLPPPPPPLPLPLPL
jgi:hypothetical protein